jgi:glycosyltransferase involved in cell wall biosynthesis
VITVSYLHGVCVRYDGISNAIRDEIRWLAARPQYDVRLFTYGCDNEDLPYTKVSEIRDVAFHPHFQRSDLVVFHFGIHYPLFNLFPVTPKGSKRLVTFHNVTPRELVAPESVETVDKSFAQIANIAFADYVVCASQTNLDVLRSLGVMTPGSVMAPPVHTLGQMPLSKPSSGDRTVRIAFIGRFVRAKGVAELLSAVDDMMRRRTDLTVQVALAGNFGFSDPAVIDAVRNTVADMQHRVGARLQITIIGDATEDRKNRLLGEADLFVLPTYHEGFCTPIPEALSSGCKIITYDNSNLPAICGGLATLVKTGDVRQLGAAIEKESDIVLSPEWSAQPAGGYAAYASAAWEYTRQFTPDAARSRFLEFMEAFVRRPRKAN